MTQPNRPADLNAAVAEHYRPVQEEQVAARLALLDGMRQDLAEAADDPLLGLRSPQELQRLTDTYATVRTHGGEAA